LFDDAVLALAARIICWGSCKNSRWRPLANASKTSVCGHAPVYKMRTKVSLLDLDVGVQTRSVHDEYQWWRGIIEGDGCWSRIEI
jgi:hypothetical protein